MPVEVHALNDTAARLLHEALAGRPKRAIARRAGADRNPERIAQIHALFCDGRDLLPFHANLLQAALDADAPVQPVGLCFVDRASGAVSHAPSFVGDEGFLGSVWRTLAAPGITAVVHFGVPERAQGRDRRAWSQALHATVDALRGG